MVESVRDRQTNPTTGGMSDHWNPVRGRSPVLGREDLRCDHRLSRPGPLDHGVVGVSRHQRYLLEPGDPWHDLPRAWTVRCAQWDGHGVRATNEAHLPPADDHEAARWDRRCESALHADARGGVDPREASRDARVPWTLKLLQPLLVHAFRVEGGRTLLALKAYADKLP